MRSCAYCGTAIDGRRPQAKYCCGACRAAASRVRAAERSSEAATPVEATKPHRNRTAGHRGPIRERRATRAEEALLARLMRKYPDLRSEAA
jgi:ribosome-binding protein aMBF1 (putative translation factor)